MLHKGIPLDRIQDLTAPPAIFEQRTMGRKILVVEDHADSREMMCLVLQSYGYDVTEASDGAEAIEIVKHFCPDLILMDVNMPKMDGLTAAQIIRQTTGCESTPIIAVTAFTDFAEQAREAGCTGILKKPVEFSHLKSVVEAQLA